MKLEQLQHRIARAEAVLEGREQQVAQQWRTIRQVWRAAWTPGRIVVAGLGLGFVAGVSEPKTALGGLAGKIGAAPKLLEMIGAVSALFAAPQAEAAAGKNAADRECPPARPQPAEAPAPPPRAPAAHPDAEPPRPAEAATEMSER